MADEILDHFDDSESFAPNTKVVVAKYFYFDAEAYLYAARLKEANIKSFISNANTFSAFPIVTSDYGLGLHVKESDLEEAMKIINRLDYYNSTEPTDQSFHDADKEDIAYEKALKEQQGRPFKQSTIILIFLILLIVLVLLRALNMKEGWQDPF